MVKVILQKADVELRPGGREDGEGEGQWKQGGPGEEPFVLCGSRSGKNSKGGCSGLLAYMSLISTYSRSNNINHTVVTDPSRVRQCECARNRNEGMLPSSNQP